MATRQTRIAEAGLRARRMLGELTTELRRGRLQAGLSQATVADALGVSRPLLAAWEVGRRRPTLTDMVRWGAVVGLDVSIRAFPGGSPLRDAGQLRLLERFRAAIGEGWRWQAEVPVSPDPRDRRAIDYVMSSNGRRVGAEAVTRLVDAQGQSRLILLKQEPAGLECMILVLADTRHNRTALVAGQATLGPAFPVPARAALGALRAGRVPPGNAVVLA